MSAMAAGSPETADGLHEQIAAIKRRVQVEREKTKELRIEVVQAEERQRLRRELDAQKALLCEEQKVNSCLAAYRLNIDADRSGHYCPPESRLRSCLRDESKPPADASGGQDLDCGDMVARGEYVWKITRFSWLEAMRRNSGDHLVESDDFRVGGYLFYFVYNPDGKDLVEGQQGSLAILCQGGLDEFAFRHTILIQAADGRFVQWGETREEFYAGEEKFACKAYGPDVHESGEGPRRNVGIFSLTHKQLLQSAWVVNDTLTVKFVLEVRPEGFGDAKPLVPMVTVPQPSLNVDMQALWEKATCSDVEFMVQGEVIKAHSPILCARSAVFETELTVGMQETASRVIVVSDCDPATFRAFLRFLYTDSFDSFEAPVPETSPEPGRGEEGTQLSQMQALLAVSHKYAVTRLQRWCEMRLAEHVATCRVCSILCQAHLLQARELEKACLSYIKDHLAEVLKLPEYAALLQAWPHLGLKINLFLAGMPEAQAEAAATADGPSGTELCGKRKREEGPG